MTPAQVTPAQAAAIAQGALARGDFATAAEALKLLVQADPRNGSLRYNLGLALRRCGRNEDALAALEVALSLAPDHLNARFEHAACLMDLGRLEEAEAAFSAYCEEAGEDADGFLNLARLRLRRGDGRAALEALARVKALRGAGENDAEIRIAEAEALQLVDREAGHAALKTLYGERPELRARLLKTMTQGPRGRLVLSATRLGEAHTSAPGGA